MASELDAFAAVETTSFLSVSTNPHVCDNAETPQLPEPLGQIRVRPTTPAGQIPGTPWTMPRHLFGAADVQAATALTTVHPSAVMSQSAPGSVMHVGRLLLAQLEASQRPQPGAPSPMEQQLEVRTVSGGVRAGHEAGHVIAAACLGWRARHRSTRINLTNMIYLASPIWKLVCVRAVQRNMCRTALPHVTSHDIFFTSHCIGRDPQRNTRRVEERRSF
mmetsp:Transcript_21067/g.45647  ORF Transcript_21067/g.45647 Transcript_21067/m.45647 type:complete len:219 (+) Transcript_21067:85-741(+)